MSHRTVVFHHFVKLANNASVDVNVTAKIDVETRDVEITSVRLLRDGKQGKFTRAIRDEIEKAALAYDEEMRWAVTA